MLKKVAGLLTHIVMFSLVCAVAAYWVIRIVTPQPSVAPPPVTAAPIRDPDPVLAARMFGLVASAQRAVATNVQIAGVFAAGPSSSAVLVVDGKPPRAYVLGQEIAPGTRLAEVRRDGVTLETSGGRQEVALPPLPAATFAAAPPAQAYTRTGNVLSAPEAITGDAPLPQTAARPFQPPPEPTPPPPPQQDAGIAPPPPPPRTPAVAQ
jgi:general secretion pathway protein C